jgi:hypothetical protein
MDTYLYLLSQQGINVPPIQIVGSSTGNTITLTFEEYIDVKDYICSLQPVIFALNNIEFNITSINNTINYIDSNGVEQTITIPPGMYEFNQVFQIIEDQTNGNIMFKVNTNTGRIDLTLESNYTLLDSTLLTNPSQGMFMGFISLNFPLYGPITISSLATPYVTKNDLIYVQCNKIISDTRMVYNN